jgi:(S)-ureidoglycine aminohydrolase
MTNTYYATTGGHPAQTELTTNRAVFTEAYAVLPRGTMRDIVTSLLPFWDNTRLWVIARPLSGFAETFSQYIVEVSPGGGSDHPEADPGPEGVLSPMDPALCVPLPRAHHDLPPGADWQVHANGDTPARFHWIRKAYQRVGGIDLPAAFFTSDNEVQGIEMPGTNGAWITQRFADPTDLRHDMHVNIVSFEPGGAIPFPETHVMEHGIYVLEGKAVYLLNRDWVEVQEGDFMWLRAFCPQACYAGGPGRFRYLLYKDVNRHATLSRQFA